MENSDLYLLIGMVLIFMLTFILGIFYIRKKLEQGKALGKVIGIPILIAFILAMILLVVALGVG